MMSENDNARDRARAGSAVAGELEIGAWRRTWPAAQHRAAVEAVRRAIARGDVYQVNLVQHLSAPFAGSPHALAARLAPLTQPNDAPLGDSAWRVLEGDGWAIVSASPELLVSRRGSLLRTRPIKGTRPLGGRDDLLASPKDAAEHLMIVDLERNDLSRVCRHGTVRWPELLHAETLAGVEHLVSTVEGELRPGVGLAEILAAVFPGGSVTGAPKIAAVDLIAALEPVGRGASMGALGRVHGTGDLDLALTIRTFAVAEGRLHLWVGGGIVWDSRARGGGGRVARQGRPVARRDRRAAPPRHRVHVAPARGLGRPPVSARPAAAAVAGRGLVDPAAPLVAADDEGFARGRAAFETLRVYGGRPFRLAEHLDRLVASARMLDLPEPDRRGRAEGGRGRARRGGSRRRGAAALLDARRRTGTPPASRSSRRSRSGSRPPAPGASGSSRSPIRAARRRGSCPGRSR